MNWFEQESQKEQVGLLFGKFIQRYIREFWNPYIGLVACQSRANMELHLSLLRQQPIKTLDIIAGQLQAQGENPLEWCFLIVLKEIPAGIPKDREIPKEFANEDGSIRIRVCVEVIPGLETIF